MSNDDLQALSVATMKGNDEAMVVKLVHEIYDSVISSAKLGSYYTAWTTVEPYKYRHVILVANRLRVLFPGSTIEHNRGKAITVTWF
jgi:hypothetical protein